MHPIVYLSVLLAVVTPFGGVDTVPAAPVEVEDVAAGSFQRAELDADRVLLRFDVRPDGSARAHVEYRFAIVEESDARAFATLQEDVAANGTRYLARFEERVGRTAAAAGNATGRAMSVDEATVRAETRQLPQPHGVVVYTFTWHGFASTADGELAVGDALSGLYLDEGFQLQVTWPDGYEARTVHESVAERRAGAAVWVGPTWFDRDGPRVVLVRSGLRVDLVPVALVGLSALFALSGLALRQRGGRGASGGTERAGEPATAANADGGTVTGGADPDQPTGSEPDLDLLSNDERVLRELVRRGGRARQQELVAALGWSDAKVSRTVRGLRERGAVEGFRIGNENVLRVAAPEGTEEGAER